MNLVSTPEIYISSGNPTWQFQHLVRWCSPINLQQLGVTFTGWWYTYPSEKYESQLGVLFPIYGKIKNAPNHQLVYHHLPMFHDTGLYNSPFTTSPTPTPGLSTIFVKRSTGPGALGAVNVSTQRSWKKSSMVNSSTGWAWPWSMGISGS